MAKRKRRRRSNDFDHEMKRLERELKHGLVLPSSKQKKKEERTKPRPEKTTPPPKVAKTKHKGPMKEARLPDPQKPATKIAGSHEMIETNIDRLYERVKKGPISLKAAAKQFGVTPEKIEEWGTILEDHDMIEMHYPKFGQIMLEPYKEKKKRVDKKGKPASPQGAKKKATGVMALIAIVIVVIVLLPRLGLTLPALSFNAIIGVIVLLFVVFVVIQVIRKKRGAGKPKAAVKQKTVKKAAKKEHHLFKRAKKPRPKKKQKKAAVKPKRRKKRGSSR